MSLLPKLWHERVACGTEEFWVPAVLAAVGTGAQYVNQSNANARQNASEVQAIQNQNQIRGNANAQIKALTSQIGQNTPAQIQGQETGAFVDTLRKNAAGSTEGGPTNLNPTNGGQSVSALAPVAGGSSRYGADKATSQKSVQDYGQTNASELGAVDAAVRQRQNEGLAMQTLGTNLQGLQAQSYTQNFVDQLRAQTAGQANPWVSLFAGLAKNGANAYATNAGGSYTGWTPKVGSSAPSAEFTNTVNPNLPYG
jgi:hypothetical protein